MNVETTPPAEYERWLLSIGVPPDQIIERMAHDFLRAVSRKLAQPDAPAGFDGLKAGIDEVLADDAIRRSLA